MTLLGSGFCCCLSLVSPCVELLPCSVSWPAVHTLTASDERCLRSRRELCLLPPLGQTQCSLLYVLPFWVYSSSHSPSLAPLKATEKLQMSFHNLLVSGKTGEVALPSPLSWGLLGSHFYFLQRVFPQSLPRIGFPLGRRAQDTSLSLGLFACLWFHKCLFPAWNPDLGWRTGRTEVSRSFPGGLPASTCPSQNGGLSLDQCWM